MNRLRLKKNALNKKTVYKKRVFRLKHPLRAPHLRAEFLERIVRAIRGFTISMIRTFNFEIGKRIVATNQTLCLQPLRRGDWLPDLQGRVPLPQHRLLFLCGRQPPRDRQGRS